MTSYDAAGNFGVDQHMIGNEANTNNLKTSDATSATSTSRPTAGKISGQDYEEYKHKRPRM